MSKTQGKRQLLRRLLKTAQLMVQGGLSIWAPYFSTCSSDLVKMAEKLHLAPATKN